MSVENKCGYTFRRKSMSAVAEGTVGRTILFAALAGGALAGAGSVWFGASRVPGTGKGMLAVLGVVLFIVGAVLAYLAFKNFRLRRARLQSVQPKLGNF